MLSRLFAQTALGKQQRKSETEHMQPTVIPDSLFAQTASGKQHQQAKKPAESVKLADQVNTNPHALQTRGTAQKHLFTPQHTLLHIQEAKK